AESDLVEDGHVHRVRSEFQCPKQHEDNRERDTRQPCLEPVDRVAWSLDERLYFRHTSLQIHAISMTTARIPLPPTSAATCGPGGTSNAATTMANPSATVTYPALRLTRSQASRSRSVRDVRIPMATFGLTRGSRLPIAMSPAPSRKGARRGTSGPVRSTRPRPSSPIRTVPCSAPMKRTARKTIASYVRLNVPLPRRT